MHGRLVTQIHERMKSLLRYLLTGNYVALNYAGRQPLLCEWLCVKTKGKKTRNDIVHGISLIHMYTFSSLAVYPEKEVYPVLNRNDTIVFRRQSVNLPLLLRGNSLG